MSTSPYGVELSPASERVFRKLPPDVKGRVRKALERLAADAAKPGRIEGKTVKTIHGLDGPFYRLRVGDHRIMYDVIERDRVVLILGIVHRSDLERWIRNR
jgi:mRNA interferase RelE/StbE